MRVLILIRETAILISLNTIQCATVFETYRNKAPCSLFNFSVKIFTSDTWVVNAVKNYY